jgi:hypothetical protein
MTFRAIYLEKDTAPRVRDLDAGELPDQGDVTVDVAYSTINYKDALAITGRSPVIRRFPMVPGIDLAGHRPGRRQRCPRVAQAFQACRSASRAQRVAVLVGFARHSFGSM